MTQERRRYYRIEDMVGIKAEPVDKTHVDKKLEQFWQDKHAFSLRNDFNYKLDQHLADLKSITKKMPELGRYLAVLQEQLNLLTEKIEGDQDDFIEEIIEASISGAGISFTSPAAYKPGDIVELHLKLLPEHQRLVMFSRVVYCKKVHTDSNLFEIALDFEYMHEADRELLIKHVHNKQLKNLNSSRLEQDQDG